MRIGIDALAWAPGRQAGVDTYLRHQVAALQEIDSNNEYVIFVSREARARLGLVAENFREATCPIYSQWRPLRAVWEQTALAARTRAEGIEALLCVGGIVPPNLGAPTIQVIHDLQAFHYPENFSWTKRRFLTWALPRSAQAAALTIASSEYTRGDVIKFLGQPPEKIRVVLLAAGTEFRPASPEAMAQVRSKYNIAGEYLLCVATAHRHKNIAGLVAAYDEAIGEKWTGKLVLAGRAGSGSAQLLAAIRASHHQDRIRLLGRVDEGSLPALYSGATAFIMPSLFEGFGMTVLEAMQCGCPVVCSNLTAAPEAAGQAALLFDPRDQRQFRKALVRIISDDQLRDNLRERGFAQARRFSWQDTAQKTLSAIQEAVRNSRILSG